MRERVQEADKKWGNDFMNISFLIEAQQGPAGGLFLYVEF